MLDLAPHRDAVAAFARRWKVRELALFGSALRDDLGPESDVDVPVRFEPGETWCLFDLATMREELTAIFGRSVDIVEPDAVDDPFFRRALDHRRVVYAF